MRQFPIELIGVIGEDAVYWNEWRRRVRDRLRLKWIGITPLPFQSPENVFHFCSISDGILAVRDPITGVSRHRQQFGIESWRRIVGFDKPTQSLLKNELEKSGGVPSQRPPDAFGKGVYSATMSVLQRALNSLQFPPSIECLGSPVHPPDMTTSTKLIDIVDRWWKSSFRFTNQSYVTF